LPNEQVGLFPTKNVHPNHTFPEKVEANLGKSIGKPGNCLKFLKITSKVKFGKQFSLQVSKVTWASQIEG